MVLVDVITPGWGYTNEERGKCKAFLEENGYEINILQPATGCRMSDDRCQFGNKPATHNLQSTTCSVNADQERFSYLKDALTNDKSDIVWCARGGYGTTRLLPMLDGMEKPKPKREKLLVGYSDITALHLYIGQRWGWRTLHASMLAEQAVDSLQLTVDAINQITEDKLSTANHQPSTIIGGNLSIISSLMGTPYQIDAKGKVIFLEDVDEKPYRIDRMLTQLKQGGVFEKAEAVLLGYFTKSGDDDLMQKVLDEFASSLNISVISGGKAGHAEPNMPIFLNTPVRIHEDGEIEYFRYGT